jgi:hypothetical protein
VSHELEKQKDKVSTTRKGEEGFGQMEKKKGGGLDALSGEKKVRVRKEECTKKVGKHLNFY